VKKPEKWVFEAFSMGVVMKLVSEPEFKKIVALAIEEKKKEELTNLL
jgi:hypothetical protein